MTDAQPINSYKEKTMNKKNILIETEEPKPEIQIEVYEMDCAISDLENIIAQLKVRLKSVIAEDPQKSFGECGITVAPLQTQLGCTLQHMRFRINSLFQSLDELVRDVKL
jgi:hypothetical protein